jgi:caa(3)-type oxidase subunit IV
MKAATSSMKALWFTYFALLLLLALTLAAHHSIIGGEGRIALVVSLAIALGKACLIAWVFMELRSSTRVARLAASAALLWIFFFYLLSSLDFLFRPAARANLER